MLKYSPLKQIDQNVDGFLWSRFMMTIVFFFQSERVDLDCSNIIMSFFLLYVYFALICLFCDFIQDYANYRMSTAQKTTMPY